MGKRGRKEGGRKQEKRNLSNILKVHPEPCRFLEQDDTEGGSGPPQNPSTHGVNLRSTSVGTSQVEVEESLGSRKDAQHWSQDSGVRSCFYDLVDL